MSDVHDVAAYILKTCGAMTAMKLQKLAYYSQAWHLVWEEKPLFDSEVQAWANGPVIYDLYVRHRGMFGVSNWEGNPDALSADKQSSIDAVAQAYGKFTAHELSEMTHKDAPWQDARAGIPEGSRSHATITPAALHEYYHGLSA